MIENHSVVPPGTYIIAVSGGVDSVVLLDILSKQKELQIIVAHFDHGMRTDSADDALFVKQLAEKYHLAYESERHELGSGASEATARKHRYAFLESVVEKYQATAIITAHHQDDVIETSIINIVRGTGRTGLSSLASTNQRVRPLLHVPKKELISYAKQHNLTWREDSTNSDTKYLRNAIRSSVVAKMSDTQRKDWLKILSDIQGVNQKVDAEIAALLRRGLHKGTLVMSRSWFVKLPHAIAREVVRALLYRSGAKEVDKKTIERLVVQIKTLPSGKTLQASGVDVLLTKRSARFTSKR